MPIERVICGYRVKNTTKVHRTKRAAMRQMMAIKASQAKKKKKVKRSY